MSPSVDSRSVPFRVEGSKIMIGPSKGYLCLPAIMSLTDLTADAAIRIDVAFLLAASA